MRSEAIILFLKQPDFFFPILEGKEPIDLHVNAQDHNLRDYSWPCIPEWVDGCSYFE
jgi:hypothetical protein